jgi:hypothetical protein
MKPLLIAAVAALAFWGCGPEEGVEVEGTVWQAVTKTEPPPPITDDPKRLSVEELFRESAPVVTSPEDRTLADREHYQVEVKPPPPCR